MEGGKGGPSVCGVDAGAHIQVLHYSRLTEARAGAAIAASDAMHQRYWRCPEGGAPQLQEDTAAQQVGHEQEPSGAAVPTGIGKSK